MKRFETGMLFWGGWNHSWLFWCFSAWFSWGCRELIGLAGLHFKKTKVLVSVHGFLIIQLIRLISFSTSISFSHGFATPAISVLWWDAFKLPVELPSARKKWMVEPSSGHWGWDTTRPSHLRQDLCRLPAQPWVPHSASWGTWRFRKMDIERMGFRMDPIRQCDYRWLWATVWGKHFRKHFQQRFRSNSIFRLVRWQSRFSRPLCSISSPCSEHHKERTARLPEWQRPMCVGTPFEPKTFQPKGLASISLTRRIWPSLAKQQKFGTGKGSRSLAKANAKPKSASWTHPKRGAAWNCLKQRFGEKMKLPFLGKRLFSLRDHFGV